MPAFTRQQLLKVLGLSGALLALPMEHLGLGRTGVAQADTNVGEAYAGFLLLANGTSVPSTVRPPRHGQPIVCGLGGQAATARSYAFDRHADVAKQAGLSLYALGNIASTLQPTGGSLITYEWGEPFVASLNYHGASVWVQTDFSQPYPFWYDASATAGSPGWPEKVDFLPTPGLQVPSGFGPAGQRIGYTYYWIKDRLLYWLKVENNTSESVAQALAQSLTPLA